MATSSARTSRTQQFPMSNRRASFPSTVTKTPNPHLPSLEEDDSVHHSSKHNFPDCQTEPDCGAQKTACWPMERGNRWRGSRSCATRESHSSGFYHLDACGGTVLAPHNFIISVHKRLGNRSYAGFGECHLCGSLLDAQLEHGENCSTAEATQGHHACVKAILGGQTRATVNHHGTQHLSSWHVRATEQMCQYLWYQPPLRIWVLLTVLFLTLKGQDSAPELWRREPTKST